MKGIVTSIQTMCYDDGPGLRTTVFLKGCPLRCFWCHNPESLDPRPQIAWYKNQCIGCGVCLEVCPSGARTGIDTPPNPRLCIQCGRCVESCAGFSLEPIGKEWEAEALVETLLSDRKIFARSGGGVTLSGGDPLLQWEFSRQVCMELKKAGIHTAIETSGFAQPEAFQTVVDAVDLVIMDLKHPDDTIHKQVTGQSNRKILANFERLCQMGKPCIIRTPVIPGVNDQLETIGAIAKLAANAPGLIHYELMPYHPLGTGKLESLGMEADAAPVLQSLTEEKLDLLRNAAREYVTTI